MTTRKTIIYQTDKSCRNSVAFYDTWRGTTEVGLFCSVWANMV